MFREGRKIRGGLLEQKIARAMDVIYRDEKDHFKVAAKQAAKLIKSPRAFKRMKKVIREISLQRVYMRYEMFRRPMTEKELKNCLTKHGRR